MNGFIELKNVHYAYPAFQSMHIPAINGIDLRITEGEYVVLAGANGSGKSTLARMLNALILPDTGSVSVASMNTSDPSNHLDIRRTVGMVFQRPEDQIIASTIEEDVAFGPENLAVPPEEIRKVVREALESVDMWSMRYRRPDQVSAGQMQRIALAGVLAMRPRCIIFDEATAMLDPAGRQSVREFMKHLHREGLTIINITHFMEETLDASRLVVLDHGKIALDGAPRHIFKYADILINLGLDLPPAGRLAEKLRMQGMPIGTDVLSVDDLVDAIVEMGNIHPIPDIQSKNQSADNVFFEVNHLDYTYMPGTPNAHPALIDVHMRIGNAAAYGLMGATGAGKSTLLQHLNGLLRPQQGDVIVDGQNLRDVSTELRAIRQKVGLVFQLPESQIFEQYVGDEIAFGPRLAGLDGEPLRERVRWAMAMVGLDFMATKDRPTFALSGGEKRKVALASVLALQPKALLLDEPTAGLDPQSRRELLKRLEVFSSQMTLVVSSHQMEDLALLVDGISVLSNGKIVMEGTSADVFQQSQEIRDLGLDIPVATQVALALKQRGWSLPDNIIRDDQLALVLKGGYG